MEYNRQGYLYWNASNERVGVKYDDGTENEGLHCGTTMQAFVLDKWTDTRLEANADGDFYLVGVCKPGQISERQQVRFF
jgi:hypothetical protein